MGAGGAIIDRPKIFSVEGHTEMGQNSQRTIRRGDVYYAILLNTAGSEQGNPRPVLIASNNTANAPKSISVYRNELYEFIQIKSVYAVGHDETV